MSEEKYCLIRDYSTSCLHCKWKYKSLSRKQKLRKSTNKMENLLEIFLILIENANYVLCDEINKLDTKIKFFIFSSFNFFWTITFTVFCEMWNVFSSILVEWVFTKAVFLNCVCRLNFISFVRSFQIAMFFIDYKRITA